MATPDNIKDFYESSVDKTAFATEEDFRSFISDENNAKEYFTTQSKDLDAFADENEFIDFIGLKKKELSAPSVTKSVSPEDIVNSDPTIATAVKTIGYTPEKLDEIASLSDDEFSKKVAAAGLNLNAAKSLRKQYLNAKSVMGTGLPEMTTEQKTILSTADPIKVAELTGKPVEEVKTLQQEYKASQPILTPDSYLKAFEIKAPSETFAPDGFLTKDAATQKEEDLNTAYNLSKTNPQASTAIIMSLAEEYPDDERIKNYSKTLSTYNALATGNLDLAQQFAQKSAEENSNADTNNLLAYVALKRGDYTKALSAANKTLSQTSSDVAINEKQAYAAGLKAKLLNDLGDASGAEKALNKKKQLDQSVWISKTSPATDEAAVEMLKNPEKIFIETLRILPGIGDAIINPAESIAKRGDEISKGNDIAKNTVGIFKDFMGASFSLMMSTPQQVAIFQGIPMLANAIQGAIEDKPELMATHEGLIDKGMEYLFAPTTKIAEATGAIKPGEETTLSNTLAFSDAVVSMIGLGFGHSMYNKIFKAGEPGKITTADIQKAAEEVKSENPYIVQALDKVAKGEKLDISEAETLIRKADEIRLNNDIKKDFENIASDVSKKETPTLDIKAEEVAKVGEETGLKEQAPPIEQKETTAPPVEQKAEPVKVAEEIPLTKTTYDFESVKPENTEMFDYYTKEVDGQTKYFKQEKSAKISEMKPEETVNAKQEETTATPIEETKVEEQQKVADEETAQSEEISIKHAETEKMRQELGLPEREKRTKKSDVQTESEADAMIKNGIDAEKLADEIIDTKKITDTEYVILTKRAADLSAKLETLDPKSKEFETTLNTIEKIFKASEVGGSEAAAATGIRARYKTIKEDTLADYFITEIEKNKGAELTDLQKETVIKEFNEIKEARDQLQKKVKELEDEYKKKEIEEEIKKEKRKSSKVKKTSAERIAERDEIRQSISDTLKKLRGELSATGVPYARELAAISPDVARLVKSYIAEGIDKLDDIVKNIKTILEKEIPDIKDSDVRDLISGTYSEKKPTRNEAAKKLFELKREAELVNELESLLSGKEPVIERKKIKRNQRIAELKKEIKENDMQKLAEYKANLIKKTEKLQSDLDSGILKKDVKKKPLKLDKEAKELLDTYLKKQLERDVRLMKEEYKNRKAYKKRIDDILEVLNIPRSIMSSMDFSAPLRQGLWASVSNPEKVPGALKQMFKSAFSQKAFDRWFKEIKDSDMYAISKDAGLYIADPRDPRLVAKEEMFMNNLAEKIPLIGKLIKGSQNAYIAYLNKLRWDVFTKFSELYESQGKTYENSPKLYKDLASYVNNATGRGNLGALENAAPILSAGIFAPRLIASRVKMLSNWANPKFYAETSKEIRTQYFKDMAKLIGAGTTVLALAELAGAEVEKDPRSSDFGKIKVGNSRWDIWGGHQQYVRVMAQLLTGVKKSATSGKLQELGGGDIFGTTRGDVLSKFARGKLAPIPSLAIDLLTGRTLTGEKTTLTGELESKLLPLLYSDIKDAYKEGGIGRAFSTSIPAMLGVSVQTYGGKKADLESAKKWLEGKEKTAEEKEEKENSAIRKNLEIYYPSGKITIDGNEYNIKDLADEDLEDARSEMSKDKNRANIRVLEENGINVPQEIKDANDYVR